MRPRGNRRVSKVTGRIETIGGGTGEWVYNGDGHLGTQTQLDMPSDVAFDRQGRMFIADTMNHRIRMFDPATGRITNIAGSSARGFSAMADLRPIGAVEPTNVDCF